MGLIERVLGRAGSRKETREKEQEKVNYVHTKVTALKKLHELISKNSIMAKEIETKAGLGIQLSKSEIEQIQWTYLSNNPYTPWEALHDSIRDIFSKEGISKEDYGFYSNLRDLDMANVLDDIVRSFNKYGAPADDQIVKGLMIIMAIVEYERTGTIRDEWPQHYKEFALANLERKQTADMENRPFKYDIIDIGKLISDIEKIGTLK